MIDEGFIYSIGKESNQFEESKKLGVDEDNYIEYKNIKAINNSIIDRILKMSEAEAHELGMSRDVSG